MGKWKWLFANRYEYKRLIPTATETLNSGKGGKCIIVTGVYTEK
jgi:hypothetical protein